MTQSTAWIILIGAVLLLLAVLYVIIARQEDRRRKIRKEPAPAPVPEAQPEPPPPPPTPVIPQLTIYQFPYSTTTCICPGCDGENDKNYRFCWICGYKMR